MKEDRRKKKEERRKKEEERKKKNEKRRKKEGKGRSEEGRRNKREKPLDRPRGGGSKLANPQMKEDERKQREER